MGARASPVPIPGESGVGSDVMKPIAAPIVGGLITSMIQALILAPVFLCADEKLRAAASSTEVTGVVIPNESAIGRRSQKAASGPCDHERDPMRRGDMIGHPCWYGRSRTSGPEVRVLMLNSAIDCSTTCGTHSNPLSPAAAALRKEY